MENARTLSNPSVISPQSKALQMGLQFSDDELAAFRKYLLDFASAHPNPIPTEGPLPLRLVCYYLNRAEIEAECIDWTLAYLDKK